MKSFSRPAILYIITTYLAGMIIFITHLEAMTSDRPYRKALPLKQVIEELKKYSGTQFDPMAVQAAVKMLQGLVDAQNGQPSPPNAAYPADPKPRSTNF